MTIFNTNTKVDPFSALVVKQSEKKAEIESLTGFIEQVQAILDSAEPTERMLVLLKSMEDQKARLEEKVANYQEVLKSYQKDN